MLAPFLSLLSLPPTHATMLQFRCFYFLSICLFRFFRENYAQHTTHARIRSVGQHKREHSKSGEVVGVGRRREKHTRIHTADTYTTISVHRDRQIKSGAGPRTCKRQQAPATTQKLFLAFKRAFEEQGRQSYGEQRQKL